MPTLGSLLKKFRIFFWALAGAAVVTVLKYFFHLFGWEIIEQSSLHNSVVAGVFFILGFLLSATIADYKESERIPSEFASILEDMYEDARATHRDYPDFDLDGFRLQLRTIALGFKDNARQRLHNTRGDIHGLNDYFQQMERAKVPPNFIVKLKQQQALLLKSAFRISYIQRIQFIPSATILARSIVALLLLMLLMTNVDPFYGGLAIEAMISFMMLYILILLQVIGKPFHREGKTKDDVSLFLIESVARYLDKPEPETKPKKPARKKRR